MEPVINAARLFLLIGAGLAYWMGQGWLAVGPLLHGSVIHRKSEFPPLHEFPLMMISGLMINYALVLCFQSLNASLVVGSVFSLTGLSCFIFSSFRDPVWRKQISASVKTYFVFAFICILFLGPILADPLNDWDARSIWFFHAKMIFSAGSIGLSAGWQHPSAAFSHVDYPNFIPAIAAQAGHVMGFWNEYLPKISLLFMLLPPVAWLFTFARRSFSFVILLLLIPFGFSHWLWNGYMDGYLALYLSIAVLLLGRYLKYLQPIDLISSASCFFAVLSLKNEGALAAISGLGALLLVVLIHRKRFPVNAIRPGHWKYLLAGLIACLPFVIWALDKQQWNLTNNLEIGTDQSFTRILNRLADGSYKVILKSVYKQTEGALLLLGVVYSASAAWIRIFAKESLPALLAAGMYALGMIMVYLMTPSDLGWHLSTSIERTMLAVSGCIFVASYFILNAVEDQVSADQH